MGACVASGTDGCGRYNLLSYHRACAEAESILRAAAPHRVTTQTYQPFYLATLNSHHNVYDIAEEKKHPNTSNVPA